MENKTEKPIAIEILNGGQLKAIEKHFAAMDWVRSTICPMGGRSNPEKRIFNIITYGDNWLTIDESNIFATNQYDIISFNSFSKLTGIKAEEEIVINTELVQYRVKSTGINAMLLGGHRFNITAQELSELHTAFHSLTH